MSDRIKLAKLDPEKIFGSRGEQSQVRDVEPENKEEKKRNRALSPEPAEVFYRFRNPVESAANDRVTREVYLQRHGKEYVRPPLLVTVKKEERREIRSKSEVGREGRREVGEGRSEVGRGREAENVVGRGRGETASKSVGRGREIPSRSNAESRSRDVSRGRGEVSRGGEVGRNRIVIVGRDRGEEKKSPVREERISRGSRGSGERGRVEALRINEYGERSGGSRSTKEESGRTGEEKEPKTMPRIRIEGREVESGGRSSGRSIENKFTQTITLSFGESSENHIGMQTIGKKADSGFSLEDLEYAKEWFEGKGIKCELICLNDYLPDGIENELDLDAEPAFILIARKGLNAIVDGDELYKEMTSLRFDTHFWDNRRKKVLNKRARHNLCFGDKAQVANYEAGEGTVIAFDDVPLLRTVRETLPNVIGDKAEKLTCELNGYYDPSKCYIGLHGDFTRRRVIAARLGVWMKLFFIFFHNYKPISDYIEFTLEHSDLYIMSEVTVGTSWKRPSIITVRHAAAQDRRLIEWKGKKKEDDDEE